MNVFKRIKMFTRKMIHRGFTGDPDVVATVVGGIGVASPGAIPAKTSPCPEAVLPAFQLDLSTLSADQFDLAAGKDMGHLMRGFAVPRETLEKWIASGFLYPEEVRVAEKLIRLMRNPPRVGVGAADKPREN